MISLCTGHRSRTPSCHDAKVRRPTAVLRPYAAYLRIYEPLSAFGRAEGRYWAQYAASMQRSRRTALATLRAEQEEAVSRLVATPPIPAPGQESREAYVRWADGVAYICPWQTRLRCWLALTRLRAVGRPVLSAAFTGEQVNRTIRDFGRWQGQGQPSSLRVFIQACTWSVPAAWFVPFAPEERSLLPATRTLSYSTAMAQARRRVDGALSALEPGRSPALAGPWQASMQITEISRWLAEFHPLSIVELDYGGLVNLLDDDALRADQSVAEVTAAISACRDGQPELAGARYERLHSRWQALEALEAAN